MWVFEFDLTWDRITALIINKQPKISLGVITSCRIIPPPTTANTDSKDKIIDAIVGVVEYFCPTICYV